MENRVRLDTAPVARADAVVQGEHWRITVLTEGLLRIEWADDGVFEDRATAFALRRDLPVPDFRVVDGPTLEIVTQRFHLVYDRRPFTPSGLSVQVRGNISAYHSIWRFGETAKEGEGGTARTLDDVDGRIPLEPGIVSRWGYAVLDDSASPALEADGRVSPRHGTKHDLYVFAYGHDHAEAVKAFYAVSGSQPALPRWALGNWWSRYFPYTADEYLALMERFDGEGVPFSVAVLDIDWHPVEGVDPSYGSGWTGYSWNRDLFPDPEAFLAALHGRGMRVTLNLHPADGVRAFEDAYDEMAKALGHDTSDEAPITFDITAPDFVEAYLGILHRRLEDQGVDFWWIDWQSGPHSRVPGIDPLWMLNHLHFLDSARDGRRGLVLSRYAGPGSHRYPVGFSGDTVISWASLDFQPEFTAAASNIGYGWWSHDIGGHFGGVRDDELTTRWVQYGVFSPIMRLHSSNNPFLVKEPWAFGTEARSLIVAGLRLRHRLVPYLHSMNLRAATEDVPLVRPMYHLHPAETQAYEVPNQYAFGSEMLVVPITSPRDPQSLQGSAVAWLPPGAWTDLFTGVVYDGDRRLDVHRDDTSIPVLLPAGGIVPMSGADDLDVTRNPSVVEVVLAPGADGSFTLLEDDGTGSTLDDIPVAATCLVWDQSDGVLTIEAAHGPAGVVPPSRTWVVTVLASAGLGSAHVDGAALDGVAGPDGRVSFTIADAPTDRDLRVELGPGLEPRTHDVQGRLLRLLDRAQWSYEGKAAVWAALGRDATAGVVLAELQALDVPPALLGAITELLNAR